MFTDKRVIVTGAAGALGRAVVTHFASLGAQVAALDYTTELLDEVFPEPSLLKQSLPHELLALDLTCRESCQEVIGAFLSRTKGVDILCNLAGGFVMGEAVHETSDQTWERMFNLNARSIINTAAVVVPQMIAQGGGKIINVAAQAARHGAPQMGVYTASKAAVMRLTESMALELRDKHINVNCIMPSIIDTPQNRADMPQAVHANWVPVAQLASVIAFLATEEAVAVHGAAIPVVGLS